MAGLVKGKDYDWKDSNLSLFGSDLERNVKKASAETEEAWQGAGSNVGIQVWRIVKFKVTHWPKEDYGKFFSGDSYIILNTYKTPPSDELLHDVHFWIGSKSTQDEYGTAAYKTVELDTFLDDKPVQHREVMNNESDLFKTYFKMITLMEGGADSGFRHVKPTEYTPHLLHFQGHKKNVKATDVPLFRESLNSGDVFILDLGLDIYQWNGSSCNKDERFKALQYLQQLKSDRGGKPKVETLNEADISSSHKFYTHLPEGGDALDKKDDSAVAAAEKVLLRLSDESGELVTTEVARGGDVKRALLDPNDVFIFDTGTHCFVWVGKGASSQERRKGMQYAHNYLMKTDHPLIPVSIVGQSKETASFNSAF
ncbi:gelsolin-like protein 2 [Corticium candelabrum]|uniref:gelsolin-like protein 2 n=1 Tax=Corticium candelabrum TaxID=121492 RepID=UPI002E256C07|nr:gelsolin-like protein 2 [Corticium candelabrum]